MIHYNKKKRNCLYKMKERAKFVIRMRRFLESISAFLKKCRGAFCRTFFEKKVLHSKKLTEKEMWCKQSLISQICPEKGRIFKFSVWSFLRNRRLLSTSPDRLGGGAHVHRCALPVAVLPKIRIHPHRERLPFPWENLREADNRSYRKRRRWEDDGRRFRR